VTGRLGSLLARALDWCADGVALVEVDCTVSHTNKAFASIARARDGIVTRKGAVEIADLQMRARLAAALGAMLREHDPAAGGFEPIDFQLARPSGAPAYIVSIRPLLGAMPHDAKCPVAVLFVRDLAARGAGDARMLRPMGQVSIFRIWNQLARCALIPHGANKARGSAAGGRVECVGPLRGRPDPRGRRRGVSCPL